MKFASIIIDLDDLRVHVQIANQDDQYKIKAFSGDYELPFYEQIIAIENIAEADRVMSIFANMITAENADQFYDLYEKADLPKDCYK